MNSIEGLTDKLFHVLPGTYLIQRTQRDRVYVFHNPHFYFEIIKEDWESERFQKNHKLQIQEIKQ